MSSDVVRRLIERGVRVLCPGSVFIGGEVRPDHVAAGVEIHPGCRIHGPHTSIGPDCVLGDEAPLTLEDCRLGHNVALRGGYAAGSVFLDQVEVASCMHVRPGSLLEESAACGHGVGLKQTILFPFVTTGSLINFCDVLMAGGTGPSNHSEVGSSYVHFNFTPQGDKATASLVGDVPRGVMLDRPPIFLGGQGGLVGPARIEYDIVIAAGTIQRGDLPMPSVLVREKPPSIASHPYHAGVYGDVTRTVRNNLLYIGNLVALREWYRRVRALFTRHDRFREACRAGAMECLERDLAERRKRLQQLMHKVHDSLAIASRKPRHDTSEAPYASQRRLLENWTQLAEAMANTEAAEAGADQRDRFLAAIRPAKGADYTAAIQALPEPDKQAGRAWLQAIVDTASAVNTIWKE